MQPERITYEEVEKIAQGLLAKVKCRPKVGIVCGSGLGTLADMVEDSEVVPYNDIPGFPVSTVAGHKGQLVFGKLGGKSVILMQGRFHCYEGYSPQQTTLPIRTMKLLGVEVLFVTNASGGINSKFNAGDIMIIKDHINFAGYSGNNPLMGRNDERFGPRFPPMNHAYDSKLRDLAKQQAEKLGFSDFLREGVYTYATGPAYETVAECRLLELIGSDTIGMSTVPEVMTASHCGLRVLGFSLVTNMVIKDYDNKDAPNHLEVLETSKKRSRDMQSLVKSVLENME